MTDQFCISVIVPFYNSELSIKRCINSILKQDFEKTFEIIMIDDASTDNSKKIIKIQNSSLIKLISVYPRGIKEHLSYINIYKLYVLIFYKFYFPRHHFFQLVKFLSIYFLET